MSDFKCPMCTDCPDNCPLDTEEDTRERSADYYKGRADGVKEFADRLRVNFDLYAWKNSDEVIDCTLAEWQKGAENVR